MKAYQLKEMNEPELKTRLEESLEAIQNLKFQKALQQLEDGSSISKLRKEIAQINTVLKEFDLGIRERKGT